jgi:lipopolysaccharide export system permease protein
VRRVPAPAFARLGEAPVADRIETRHLSVEELRREIEDLRASGIDATPFRVDLYVKLATPFACLVLPALALFFALGGPPHPSPPATLVFSAIVAVGYTLLTGLGKSLGYGEIVLPAVAGMAPVLVFAGAAGYLGLRLSVFR